MARYELRRWTDNSRTKFVVRQSSDDYSAINMQYNRAFFASTEPSLLFVYDTETVKENDQ